MAKHFNKPELLVVLRSKMNAHLFAKLPEESCFYYYTRQSLFAFYTCVKSKTIIDNAVFLEAKSLLRQTSMSVQQICHHLNYSDASYFTKAFKIKEGFTPLEYRNQ